MYDILIIGAGPAGLAAAIYGKRAAKSVLVIEKESFGGQMNYSPKIENYPGFTEISGMELSDKMVEQAMALGAEFELCKAVSIEKQNEKITVKCDDGSVFEAKTVIVATGAKHRHLGLPGEEELIGEGISYCAVCDGAFYEGKEIAVIGGGNSALQESVLLSKTSKKVTILQNLSYLTGEKNLQDILNTTENVDFHMNCEIKSFSKKDDKVEIHLAKDGEETTMAFDGVFVAVGLAPDNEDFKDIISLENGYVLSDENCKTSADGIFTAGDCRTKNIHQIATAIADGSTAALNAVRYLG